MTQRITRRSFLKRSACAGALIIVGPGAARTYAANEKLNAALIGVSGRGEAHVGSCARENFVAMCDCDEKRMAKAAKEHPQTKTYADYRKLFDAHKDLNAVCVAAPDHHHFLASMLAIEVGAGVYTEKPLTHSVWEARKLAEFARKKKVASQCGNQGHSGEGCRRICEYVWSGTLGDVTEVHCCTVHGGKRGLWAQGMDRPKETPPVPAGLDWESWIGPAPMRTYHKGLHPFYWRGWQDFGTGGLGDQACHVMDAAFMALKLAEAESVDVSAECTPVNKESYPVGAVVTYKFPARGKLAAATLKWFLGDKTPPRPQELEAERNMPEHGTLYYGSKAIMMSGQYCDGVRIIPETKHKATPVPPVTLPRVQGGHWEDFVRACKGGPAASSNYDYSGPLTELALLGNIAIRTGKGFTWKVKEMKAVDCPEADALVKRDPRKGWDFGY